MSLVDPLGLEDGGPDDPPVNGSIRIDANGRAFKFIINPDETSPTGNWFEISEEDEYFYDWSLFDNLNNPLDRAWVMADLVYANGGKYRQVGAAYNQQYYENNNRNTSLAVQNSGYTSKLVGKGLEGNGFNWYSPVGKVNAVYGASASLIQSTGGSMRLGTSNKLLSVKYYKNSWTGNQYAKTLNLNKTGYLLGKVSLGIGVVMDVRGMMIYKHSPNSPNAVHPGKVGVNTVMGAYGLWVNPIVGTLYFGVDSFYPGGWPAALEKNAEIKTRDRQILGFYPKD